MEGDPDKYIFLGGALIVIGVIAIFSSLTKSSNAVLMSGIISMIGAIVLIVSGIIMNKENK